MSMPRHKNNKKPEYDENVQIYGLPSCQNNAKKTTDAVVNCAWKITSSVHNTLQCESCKKQKSPNLWVSIQMWSLWNALSYNVSSMLETAICVKCTLTPHGSNLITSAYHPVSNILSQSTEWDKFTPSSMLWVQLDSEKCFWKTLASDMITLIGWT